MRSLLSLFLSPRGRIARPQFAAALAAFVVFLIAQHYAFEAMGTNAASFYIAPLFFFLNLHIAFCVFGKRLHDFGRSTWPFIGMLALMCVAAIILMLNFGGLEYFDTLMSNPQIAEDAVAMEKLNAAYQAQLAESTGLISALLYLIPGVFTLWLLLRPSDPQSNRYGHPPVAAVFS